MTSLLFQSTGKTGGSSSSSSANPFMDLANFYEQELLENNDESNRMTSNSFRQQNHALNYINSIQNNNNNRTRQHLFPSFSPSTESPTFSVNKNTTTNTYTRIHDDFNTFTQLEPKSSLQTPETFQQFNDQPANSDLTEYLRKRHEYYFQEAMARSQDRNDGLGPIVDFSQSSSSHLHDESLYSFHNIYTDRRQKASSQREQVIMDMNQVSHSHPNNHLDKAWQNATSSSAQANSGHSINSSGSVSNHPVIPTQDQSRLKSHGPMDMQTITAANLGWTQEFERADLTSQRPTDQSFTKNNERRGSLKTCGYMFDPKIDHDTGLVHPEALLSFATSSTVASAYSSDRDQALQSQIPESCKVYNDDEFEGQMRQAWMETLAQERQEEIERINDSNQKYSMEPSRELQIDENDGTDMLEAWSRSLEQEMKEADELVDEKIEKSLSNTSNPPNNSREVFGDDVFESDMLQSWMEILALERKERIEKEKNEELSKEREKEKEENVNEDNNKSIDEAEQKLKLEMALRRLNGLMHQLGRKKVL